MTAPAGKDPGLSGSSAVAPGRGGGRSLRGGTAGRGARAATTPWVAALLLLTPLAQGCGGTAGEPAPAPDAAAVAAPAAPASPAGEPVETTTVARGLMRATVTASGSVRSPRVTELGPEVGGRLVKVLVDVGDTVREGAPVFRIDPEEYELDLEEAEAGLALARAELEQAEQEMERARRLAEEKVMPQQQLDTQVTHHAVQLARVTQAEARVHRAEQDLERTTVHAPYHGFVVERRLHEGAMLNPASVVLTLQQAGGYEAILAVPEAARLPVRPGDPVELAVEGVAGRIESRVRAVNARIDPSSRTYEVRVPIAAPPETPIKAGAFVRGDIEPIPVRESLLLDREAILVRDGRSYAFRLQGDRVEQVPIELGAVGARIAEIHRGLDLGDRLVVGDVVERLADGAPVRPSGERSLPPGSSPSPPQTGGEAPAAAPDAAAVVGDGADPSGGAA